MGYLIVEFNVQWRSSLQLTRCFTHRPRSGEGAHRARRPQWYAMRARWSPRNDACAFDRQGKRRHNKSLYWSHFMEAIYSDVTISMSEFKKNPAAVLRDAKSKPVAVLNHNKAAFYMVEPALFEALLEELSDQDLHRTVLSRMGERSRAIEVDIDEI